MLYRQRLRLAIDTFECGLIFHSPFYSYHLEALAKLRQELNSLLLQMENEPMSEPQFMQSVIRELEAPDGELSYEGYLDIFAEAKE